MGDEVTEVSHDFETMDELKNTEETFESNCKIETSVERMKSMNEISTCKVTKCSDEITGSTCKVSKNGNEMTENIDELAKCDNEVKNTYHVKRNVEEEAVVRNTNEEIQTSDKVTKNNVEMTNKSDEVREDAVMVGETHGITDGLAQKKVSGTGNFTSSENIKNPLNEQKKEYTIETKICTDRSHTTPVVEENFEHSDDYEGGNRQKIKKNTKFLEEGAKIDGDGNEKKISRKVTRSVKVPADVQKRCEFMRVGRIHSQILEEKQDGSFSKKLSNDESDDSGKDVESNSRRGIKNKRMDEKGKRRHASYSNKSDVTEDVDPCRKWYSMERDIYQNCFRREGSCSSKDFEKDVTNFLRDSRRKSSHSSGRKSSSPRFDDENISYSRENEIDVAHYSGWSEKEGHHIKKRGRFNGNSFEEEDDSESWDIDQMSYMGKACKKETNNQRLYKRENEHSVCWNQDESNSSWNELGDGEVRDQYMTGDINERNLKTESTENYTKVIGSGPSVSRKVSIADLVARSGVMINEDIRRKFAKACVSFLKNLNQIPSSNETIDSDMIPDDWHCRYSGRDAVPPYRRKRSYSQNGSSFISDFDPAQTGFARYRSRTRSRNSRKKNFYEQYSTADADTQYGQDWSCSPEIGYNSDEWYCDQNSRYSSGSRPYSSGRHCREHDVLYSASHSQRHRHSSNDTEAVEKEEDPTVIFRLSSEKIRKQCERERDPAIRRALLSLFDAHDHECLLYLKQPDAHPDYNKEYRMFVQQKIKSIIELGGDPNTFNFHFEWRKYWPTRMNDLFRENWEMKMQQCTSFLSQKSNCFSSESSSDSSSSSSTSSSSSDDSTDSDTREKKHRYSKRKKMLRSCKSTTISGRKEKKQEKKCWKPIKKVEEGTDDLTLELDIKRFRERSESHSLDKFKSSEQASFSLHLNDQNQGSLAIQVVDVLKVLNHMKERFGELEKPFNTLYLKAVNMKENDLNSNEILEEEESCCVLEKLGEKLENLLEDENQTVIQKVITREAHERFKPLLLKIREKSPFMGLDIGSIARITMGKDECETLTFIRNALLYQGHSSVANEKLMHIYLKVKEEHKNIEYVSNAQRLMSYKNSVFSFPNVSKGKGESNLTYEEPSQCQQHIQAPFVYTEPFLSGSYPDYHSSFNGPLAGAPMMPATLKNSVRRTLKPVSIVPSLPPNSSKKESSHVVSTSTDGVNTSPAELREVSSVSKEHCAGKEQSSPSTSSLVTSPPASPIKTDLSTATVQVSQVESIPTTSEAITSVSECESMVDSKLYQNTIKDCFITPSSSPREDPPLASSEDQLQIDFKNPEFSFSNPFSRLLEVSPLNSSESPVNLYEKSSEIITSASVATTSNTNSLSGNSNMACEEPSTTFSKKPIRITIPQLSKQKGFIPSFSPINDDQELL